MNQEIIEIEPLEKAVTETGLTESAANNLRDSFVAFFADADKWRAEGMAIKVIDETDKLGMAKARECRLAVKAIRIGAEKQRKAMKAESLAIGKGIDGVANVLKMLIAPVEKHLEEQEQFIVRMIEDKRQAKNAARQATIDFAGLDMLAATFESYTDEAFTEAVEALESAAEAKEAARVAEENKDRLERERLRAEAAEAQKVIATERAARQAAEKAAQAESARVKELERKIESERAASISKENARIKAEADKRNDEIKAAEESMRAEFLDDMYEYPSTDKKNLKYWAEGIFKAYENNPPKMTTEPGRVAAQIINEAITAIQTAIRSL
jgi:hypothetical protein